MGKLFTPGPNRVLIEPDPDALAGKAKLIYKGTRPIDSRPSVGRIKKRGAGVPETANLVIYVWNDPVEVMLDKQEFLVVDFNDIVLFAE